MLRSLNKYLTIQLQQQLNLLKKKGG